MFLDPRMFTPDNRKEWRIDSFYGAFRSWDRARDFVILYRDHMEPPPPNDRAKSAIAQWRRWMVSGAIPFRKG